MGTAATAAEPAEKTPSEISSGSGTEKSITLPKAVRRIKVMNACVVLEIHGKISSLI